MAAGVVEGVKLATDLDEGDRDPLDIEDDDLAGRLWRRGRYDEVGLDRQVSPRVSGMMILPGSITSALESVKSAWQVAAISRP